MAPASVRFGGDYNPEHWPDAVIEEDLRLMRRAGVTLVSVGIFGWATVQPRPGPVDAGYYRRVLDRLHEAGIGVGLATMTASPPPWLSHRYPQILPELADGTVLSPGARQHYCPSSQEFREAAGELVRSLAEQLGDHPAVRMWHLNNEYACHVRRCWCDDCAAGFRDWLRDRYGGIDALNAAWTTTFWSQRYSDFDEILPPRVAPTLPNNAQQLDYSRFTSDSWRALMRTEIAVLRAATPQVPVTHNFAAVFPPLDLWSFARELDVVSFDSYPDPADADSWMDAAFDYGVIRSLRAGRPWLLMEQAPSAVNWRRRNAPKPPGKMRAGSWQAVAHGADAVMFFQWRASPGGAEKFHSAMVGHTGPDGRVFGEVAELGAELAAHPEPTGLATRNDTAFLLDWNSWWAGELESHPTADLTLRGQMRDWYRRTARLAVPTDAVHPGGDLAPYRLLIAPSLYLLTRSDAQRLTDWVRGGGVLVLGYFSSVADENDRIHPGGAPGPLRDAIGATVAEWWPLQPGEQLPVRFAPGGGRGSAGDDGGTGGDATDGGAAITCVATDVAEDLTVHGAEVLATFGEGDLAGRPAVLRRRVGAGKSYYVGARLDAAGIDAVLRAAMADAQVRPLVAGLPAGVEVVPRGPAGSPEALLFMVNHTPGDVEVRLDRPHTDLLTPGAVPASSVRLARYGVAMLRAAAIPR